MGSSPTKDLAFFPMRRNILTFKMNFCWIYANSPVCVTTLEFGVALEMRTLNQ